MVTKQQLNDMLKNRENKKWIKEQIEMLPGRFRQEFIEDVIVDEASLDSFRKVYTYYVAEIWSELTDNEKEAYSKEYILIEL